MKIVTRSGVFETNSSSVHSYTYPIKSERISFKGWARSLTTRIFVTMMNIWVRERNVGCL